MPAKFDLLIHSEVLRALGKISLLPVMFNPNGVPEDLGSMAAADIALEVVRKMVNDGHITVVIDPETWQEIHDFGAAMQAEEGCLTEEFDEWLFTEHGISADCSIVIRSLMPV